MRGKLIVIEGTDCSGKETQTKLLQQKLENENIKCIRISFPDYDTPTGKIVGGPYLGKEYICNGWFEEGATNVDPKVASLYYAADRKYNINKINELLESGFNVILDRYVYSNMAHQGGKIDNKDERQKMYKWLDELEFGLLELPKLDIGIFLHMPFEASLILKQGRKEKLDQHEMDREFLEKSETAYKEVADIYNFYTIECSINNEPKTIEDINKEVYEIIYQNLIK